MMVLLAFSTTSYFIYFGKYLKEESTDPKLINFSVITGRIT
ncbi:MAG: hypothetical protein ACTSXK_09455 [Promethearchaeota archaeon]